MANFRDKKIKRKRVQYNFPPDHVEAFQKQAIAEDMSFSEWVDACCIANLPKEIQKTLTPFNFNKQPLRNPQKKETENVERTHNKNGKAKSESGRSGKRGRKAKQGA